MAKKPNLLYVFADQLRRTSCGYAGYANAITPNIDAFHDQSMDFCQAVSGHPVCAPYRATLFTGKYTSSTGMVINEIRINPNQRCIGHVLTEGGYETAYIGKWHLDEPEQNNCPEPASGARDWDAFTPPGARRHGFDYWYSYGTYDRHLTPHYWRDTPDMIRIDEWSVQHETTKAIEYLRDVWTKDAPFALYVSWNPPHSFYDQVPQKYLDLYPDVKLKDNVSMEHIHHHTGELMDYTPEQMKLITRQYYAAVSGLDDQFGRLLSYLKETGLYEDTVIVLSADHGDMMGSHGLMGKHVWYEESIRIPFVVRVPGAAGRVCRTCIGSQDMTPTVLGLLGVPVPATVEGEDCSAYLTSDREDLEKVSFLLACPGRDVFLKNFAQAGKDPKTFGWRGVRTQDYTYVMELGYDVTPRPARYLYCTAADPQQMHPLALDVPENRRLAAQLEASVLEWMRRQNDGFAENWNREATPV